MKQKLRENHEVSVVTTSKLKDAIEKKQNKNLYLNLEIITLWIYFTI